MPPLIKLKFSLYYFIIVFVKIGNKFSVNAKSMIIAFFYGIKGFTDVR